MEIIPICQVCHCSFTLRGPSPFLLPCLHDVCEKCLTFAAGGIITCNTCKCDVNLSKVKLQKDAATENQILHITIKTRPEDLLCTHEEDGNQAVCWCQDCEEMLCESCQKMHQSFKALNGHHLQTLTDIKEDTLQQERYCTVHKSYPLDTWDKTCRLLLCSRCSRTHHEGHELVDIEHAARSLKQRLKSTETKMKSAWTAHMEHHSDMCLHKEHVIHVNSNLKTEIVGTFSTLRAEICSKEKSLLGKLDQLTESLLDDISQDMRCSEARKQKCKALEEYTGKCLQFAPNHEVVSFDDRTAGVALDCISGTPLDKLDLKVPVFNNDGFNELLELISCFSDVAEEIVSDHSGSSTDKVAAQSEMGNLLVEDEEVKQGSLLEPQPQEANNVAALSRENEVSNTDLTTETSGQTEVNVEHTRKSSGAPTTTEKETVSSISKPPPSSCGANRPTRAIPLCGLPSPLPDPSTVTTDLTRLRRRGCKIYETPSAWSRGTPYLESAGLEEELYRKVRSILNKLTPQKFQTLIKQVQGLVIDTETRLKGVTDMIYEKAISEPAFSVAYANMCRYLLTLKVPSDTKQGESVNFRVILLTRCQREFEKDKDTQLDLDRRKKDIEEAKDPEKVAEMKEELNQAATNARRRSIGDTRFVGELFKLKMLTETIMHDCVFKLLRSRDEENLECLCRLLTTIGKELESDKAKPRMDQYFRQMKKIVAEKKVSPRCRFMLQDVIDLRDSNWKPRRDDNNPKTIDQIHKKAKREAVEQNMLTALHMSQQPSHPQHHQSRHNKAARGRPGGQAGGSMEEGWNTVSSKAIRNIDRNIDVSKLRIEKNGDENIQLSLARSFGGWGRGSSGGGSSRASQEGEKPTTPGNRYSALIKEDDQRSPAFGPARGEGDRMRGNQPGGGFQ